jgi:hypothetical protein
LGENGKGIVGSNKIIIKGPSAVAKIQKAVEILEARIASGSRIGIGNNDLNLVVGWYSSHEEGAQRVHYLMPLFNINNLNGSHDHGIQNRNAGIGG